MVIDVQTGETHAASVMTRLFNRCYDSYTPTQTQNTKLYYGLIKLTLPPTPLTSSPSPSKENTPQGMFLLIALKKKKNCNFYCERDTKLLVCLFVSGDMVGFPLTNKSLVCMRESERE